MGQETRARWDEKVFLFAIIIILLSGSVLRTWHLFVINLNEPFRLGALYYEFAEQIIEHQFQLPDVIPYYSQNGLPFAYPPLAFYIEALFIKFFNLPKFLLVNILPPILSIFSLISFYILTTRVLKNKVAISIALMVFSIMPNAFADQIEAGGLAESIGTLVIIWYLFFLYRYLQNRDKKSVVLSGVFLGLNVLSSPGSAYAAILISLLAACYIVIQSIRMRQWKHLGPLLLIAGIGLIISSPYWLTNMIRHGKGIFFVSFLAQHLGSESAPFLISEMQKLFDFNIAGGSYPFVLDFLIFLGFVYMLFEVDFSVLAVLILFILIPREGVWLAPVPGAILAGYGCSKFWQELKRRSTTWLKYGVWKMISLTGLGAVLIVFLYSNSLAYVKALIDDKQWDIQSAQINSLENGKPYLPTAKPVLLIGNEGLKEWGPQILEREVLNTKYGLEWQPYELERVNYLNDAIHASDDFSQLSIAVVEFMDVFDYYVVSTDKQMMSEMLENTQFDLVSVDVVYDDDQINILHMMMKE